MTAVRDEVFAGLVLLVTLMGFVAARWGGANLQRLDEWALGGGASEPSSPGS